MREAWQQATLKDLCVVDWGNTNLTKSAYVQDGKFMAVSAAGCDGRIGHSEHLRHTPVLSAIGAQCGKMFFPDEDFTAIKNTITLTPKPGKCVGKFLYYLLAFVELPQRGAGQPFISKGDVQSFSVSFPGIPEQNRIVAILDEASEGIDTAVANVEKNLANARELFERYLNAAFSQKTMAWMARGLGGIAEIKYGFTASASFVGDGPRFLRITDIKDDGVDWSAVPTCEIDNEDFSRHQLRENDIVFARTGATTGKSFLISSAPKSIAASYLIRCRLTDKGVLAPFVARYFQTQSYWRHIAMGTTGSAQGGFNASKLSELLVPMPPTGEQKQLVLELDCFAAQIKLLESTYKRKLEGLMELKQAILRKAFAGELTVRPVQALQEAAA